MSKFTYGDLAELKNPTTSFTCALSAIAHIDLDAFYAQCEQVRRSLSSADPVVCRQWNSVIAVSYGARKFGIKRGMNVTEVSTLCPSVVLAHVATFKKGEIEWKYADENKDPPSPVDHKVSLDPYRRESRKIFKIFKSECQYVEKGGIDEAFMDLGPKVYERISTQFPELDKLASTRENRDQKLPLPDNSLYSWVGVIGVKSKAGEGTTEEHDSPSRENSPKNDCQVTDENYKERSAVNDWDDTVLMIASQIVREIRSKVYEEVGYTCSAGIGHNRYIAKLASAKNKPNNQTVVPSGTLDYFLDTVELGDVWGMGGKLGEEITQRLNLPEKGSMRYVRDKFTEPELQQLLGGEDVAKRVYQLVRGTYSTEISTRTNIKSMLSVKQFPKKLSSLRDVEDWMRVFAADIAGRLLDLDHDYNSTFRPQTISVSMKQFKDGLLHAHSKQTKVTGGLVGAKTVKDLSEQLLKDGLRLVTQLKGESKVFPCSSLSLSVSNIEDIRTLQTVDRYFTKVEKKHKDETPEEEVSLFVDEDTTEIDTNNNHSNENSLLLDDSIRCERCNKVVAIDEVAEHSDWHYAMDLSREDQPSQRQQQPASLSKKRARSNASVLDMLKRRAK